MGRASAASVVSACIGGHDQEGLLELGVGLAFFFAAETSVTAAAFARYLLWSVPELVVRGSTWTRRPGGVPSRPSGT